MTRQICLIERPPTPDGITFVHNPIYAGFLAILTGQVLLFGSKGLLEYTALSWCIGAAAVRFYEEPTLARKFGAGYQDYRRAVRAWIPRLHPGTPGEPTGPAEQRRSRVRHQRGLRLRRPRRRRSRCAGRGGRCRRL